MVSGTEGLEKRGECYGRTVGCLGDTERIQSDGEKTRQAGESDGFHDRHTDLKTS